MTVLEFVSRYINSNSIIRLHNPIIGGHYEIEDSVMMAHRLKNSKFAKYEFIEVFSLLSKTYQDAINISISTKEVKT